MAQTALAASGILCPARSLTGQSPGEEHRLAERLAQDPQRPIYHFLPKANWVNDPNGPIFWKGYYHLFYQYSSTIEPQGPKYWGHGRSKDLVYWEHLPMALAPTPGGPDKDGCWSGSAFINHGVPTLVYTGVDPQVQCVAKGNDGLVFWRKLDRNPVVAGPPVDLKVTGFRDPSIWREGDWWWMTVGAGFQGQGGAVLLYASKDLSHWDYLSPLFSGPPFERRESAPAHPYDAVDAGDMWECPDFFPLGSKHVLLVSTQGRVHYFLGTYAERRFHAETQGLIDGSEMYYAAKSFAHERRILWGWIRESRSAAAQNAAGWSGAISLPRILTLDPSGGLRMDPAPELASLRGAHAQLADVGIVDFMPLPHVAGDALEIRVAIDLQGASEAGLSVRRAPHAEEETTISYDSSSGDLVLNTHRSSLSPDAGGNSYRAGLGLKSGETLRIAVFLDGSIVEVFANSRACLTGRIYPTRTDSVGVGLFAKGGRARLKVLDAYVMNAISRDRLTGMAEKP